MDVNESPHEGREISAIDDLLPSLYEAELLTDIECRIIVRCRSLEEKQLVLFRMMISKNKQTAAQLFEIYRAMSYNLYAEEKLTLQESDHNSVNSELDSPFEANKNPMLNNTVIKCIFGFLPLDDIKNCSLVCRQWNSTAEVFLRKLAQIHFRPDGLRPATFLAVSKFSLPNLPFPAFKFSEMNTNLSWRKLEMEDFFEKWGKNIKELDLRYININCTATDDPSKLIWLDKYDVTSWFKNMSNITSLKIEGLEEYNEELNMSISLGELEFLSKIKTFVMKGNTIETCSNKNIRMVPINIELSNINCKRDDAVLEQFRYNDLFDFSQAVTIRLSNCEKNISEVTFDMSDQVFTNTDLLDLDAITIANWKNAKGYIRHVDLLGIPFIEQNLLEIQSLKISTSAIDLFALPLTVERIEVDNCDISCSQPLSLPKLKFLKLYWDDDYSSEFKNFKLEKCDALKELVIYSFGDEATSLTRMFDVKRLPTNLQALRIKGNLSLYLTDNCTLSIRGFVVLDADNGSRFSDYTRIAAKFLSGTLVIVCRRYMKVTTDDIVTFLLEIMKRELQKIIIGVKDEIYDLHAQTPFEGSWISRIVDSKSNYYEFENQCGIVGKAISRDQFLNGCISVGGASIPFFLEGE